LGLPVIFTYCKECFLVYHRKCLSTYLKNYSSKCPMCRKSVRITRSQDPFACGRARLHEIRKRMKGTKLIESPHRLEPVPGEIFESAYGEYLRDKREREQDEASLALAKKLEVENAQLHQTEFQAQEKTRRDEQALADELYARELYANLQAEEEAKEQKQLEDDRRMALDLANKLSADHEILPHDPPSTEEDDTSKHPEIIPSLSFSCRRRTHDQSTVSDSSRKKQRCTSSPSTPPQPMSSSRNWTTNNTTTKPTSFSSIAPSSSVVINLVDDD